MQEKGQGEERKWMRRREESEKEKREESFGEKEKRQRVRECYLETNSTISPSIPLPPSHSPPPTTKFLGMENEIKHLSIMKEKVFPQFIGLRSLFSLILGEENATDDTQRMMQMSGSGFDPTKLNHKWLDIDERVESMIISVFESAAIIHPEMHDLKSSPCYTCVGCMRARKYDAKAVFGGEVVTRDFLTLRLVDCFLNESNPISRLCRRCQLWASHLDFYLGDFLGEDAENFISSRVNAPKIGLSSGLIGEFDPCDMFLSGVLISEVLLFLIGAFSVEDNQFKKLILVTCFFLVYRYQKCYSSR
ncbi:hypothetical protein DITRI_Ditri11bG0073600 [Diplodiscus trichospermus]